MALIELSCQDVLAKLSDYVDLELEEAFRRAVDEHAALCPRCKVVLDTFEGTVRVFKEGVVAATIPVPVHDRLMKALQDERERMKPKDA